MGQRHDERGSQTRTRNDVSMRDEIVNRVANSGLITFDLEEYYPKGKRTVIDLKDWLFEELILKEKDFREQVKQHDWSQYKDQYVTIDCKSDAIVPVWAYMLIASSLMPYAKTVARGSLEQLESLLFQSVILDLDVSPYKDQRVIIKGCSNLNIVDYAYMAITTKLRPLAKSIMYGEACSSVPIFKRQ
ncbi:MAG: DUF2480 family protein [Bacteroidota bacterium]|nr:DUF2480 family protein [Bacteroidota bacterium]